MRRLQLTGRRFGRLTTGDSGVVVAVLEEPPDHGARIDVQIREPGDLFEIDGAATADATLANFGLNLAGVRA